MMIGHLSDLHFHSLSLPYSFLKKELKFIALTIKVIHLALWLPISQSFSLSSLLFIVCLLSVAIQNYAKFSQSKLEH